MAQQKLRVKLECLRESYESQVGNAEETELDNSGMKHCDGTSMRSCINRTKNVMVRWEQRRAVAPPIGDNQSRHALRVMASGSCS
eukprot:11223621-Lingulodinium_polyedra.AAC.1